MKKNLLIVLAFLMPIIALSNTQGADQSSTVDSTKMKAFHLGEVTIIADRGDEMNNRISSIVMEQHNKMEVSKALNMLPGINLTASGVRNESMVTVRGFDLRQIPVYMDGIPVYIPYDGYVDLARFTTFDLSVIDVSKGFSSILYGPNSLGGAINLISRKPYQKNEMDGSVGMINTNSYKGNINFGSNLGQFYIQGGYSYLHRDSYKLSSKYKPTENGSGKTRENSYRTDQKVNFKIGWTPSDQHEYVFAYINQQGEKGTPIYSGKDSLNSLMTRARYWQWPNWDKETYYFLSKTKIDNKNSLKTKLYYDIFKNSLFSYDDATYSTMTRPYAFKSRNNAYTYGGGVEYGTTIVPKNNLKLALDYKSDVHKDYNEGEPERRFEDNMITVGLENIYSVSDKFVIIPGFGYSTRKNIQAEDYNSSTNTISDFAKAKASKAYNAQLGLFYYLKNNQKIGASVSQKTRFATIKDRYSYRMGTAIPNPDLKPETAANFELNYEGKHLNKFSFQMALFYSRITDAILNINNVEPGKSQIQNGGRAEFMGVETGVKYDILTNLLLGANYTYIERNNLTDPTLHFIDVPNSKVFSYIQYEPKNQIRMMASAEYNSSRYSTSYGTQTPSFTLVNALVSSKVWKHIRLEAGVDNIFDTNYSLVEGYPEEGRSFFVTLRFFNHD